MKVSIDTVIFDLGKVLVYFHEGRMLRNSFEDRKVQEKVRKFYFSSLWDEYDRGVLSRQQMTERGQEAFEDCRDSIAHFMNSWTEYVIPISRNLELLDRLRAQGKQVLILSNLPMDAELALLDKGVFDHVDGYVGSWRENVIKPDPEIYRRLIQKYDLVPSRCLFVDDRPENVRAAKKLGFQAAVIKDPDDLEKVVRKFV